MHRRHITTAFCLLYVYFVSEVSGQDKDRDKEHVENAGTDVFYLTPWFKKESSDIYSRSMHCKDGILEGHPRRTRILGRREGW